VLFDLQSPRRRRVIRVTFGALAAIFAISFVFLGVGTGGGGFSFSDLFGGGGGTSGAAAFEDQIDTAQQKVATNPSDSSAIRELVTLHYQAGTAEIDINGSISSEGEDQLRQSVDSWTRYVKATGQNADPGTAAIAYQAFSILFRVDGSGVGSAETGSEQLQALQATVDDLKGAGSAQSIVATAQPKVGNWAKAASAFALAGDSAGTENAIAQAKKANPKAGAKLEKALKQAEQQGQKIQQAIDQLTKQQAKSQGGGGDNPLSGLPGGGGSLGGIGTGGP
jgi:hypothetical protein